MHAGGRRVGDSKPFLVILRPAWATCGLASGKGKERERTKRVPSTLRTHVYHVWYVFPELWYKQSGLGKGGSGKAVRMFLAWL